MSHIAHFTPPRVLAFDTLSTANYASKMNTRGERRLPASRRLSIGTLAGLFRNTTNSYKYLFFLALIRALRNASFQSPGPFNLHRLQNEMLTVAWYPHQYFRLSFGASDQVGSVLAAFRAPQSSGAGKMPRAMELRREFGAQISDDALMRYVPTRLIRPFFAEELRGEKDHHVDERITRLASEQFDSVRPLYQFSLDRSAILVHPEWLAYLRDNAGIVEEWALWEWLKYMQARNPNTPNIGAKLMPPGQRAGLAAQRGFWQTAMAHWPAGRLRCPYSAHSLDSEHFALDHLLPWAFVAHDRLWNLVPADPSVNSSKSNRVPVADYLQPVAELHATALCATRDAMSSRRWQSHAEQYLTDLHSADYQTLLRTDEIQDAYLRHVEPLLHLARSQGFPGEWRWE
jgi:hypothetical protein